MNFKQFWILILGVIISFSSCKSDDDGDNQLPQSKQNEVDNEAIVLYLKQHYFNSVGKSVKFSDEDASDDNETSLFSIAQQVDDGYWYVKRPNVNANGRAATNNNNDSILIQYDLKTFTARLNIEKDSIFYTTPIDYASTINTTGIPQWDPSFYYVKLTEAQQNLNYQKKWYEIEGVIDGLTYFNSTGRETTDLPAVNFQGLIIVPSRLVFGREPNKFNFTNDTSVILNFELYKVIDRSVQ